MSLPPPPPLQVSKTIRDMNVVHDRRINQLEADITDLIDLNRAALDKEDGEEDENDDDKDSESSSSTSGSSESSEDELEENGSSDTDDEDAKTPAAVKEVRFETDDNRIKGRTAIKKAKKTLFKDDRPPFILDIDEVSKIYIEKEYMLMNAYL